MSAQNFAIGGTLGNTYTWASQVDDDTNIDSDGKLTYDGIVQYQWDLIHSNGSTAGQQYIVYVPGTTTSNGIWFWDQGTSVDQTILATHSSSNPKTRDSNQECNFSTWETTSWQTADAFVNGVIPTLSSGSGGGTSTEGVPTVEWSAFFSKDPGSDYWRWTVTGLNTDSADYIYLYDYMPTVTSTDPAIGQRSFAASSSSSTQYGLFTPDLSKTYYVINFLAGSSSTNLNAVVLASKNFSSKKVFSNFW